MPRKIIHIFGAGNSGKSDSIRRYLLQELNLMGAANQGLVGTSDILVAIKLSRKRLTVGVASGGDNVNIVRRNFQFFRQQNCDVIVCASKSGGTASFNEVIRQLQSFNPRPVHVPIQTTRGQNIGALNQQIAQQVYQSI